MPFGLVKKEIRDEEKHYLPAGAEDDPRDSFDVHDRDYAMISVKNTHGEALKVSLRGTAWQRDTEMEHASYEGTGTKNVEVEENGGIEHIRTRIEWEYIDLEVQAVEAPEEGEVEVRIKKGS